MEKRPALPPTLVQEFVGNAHGNLARVQELLQEEPTLLNAAWDWGDGDWETALGAASHMGRKDIAQYLLSQGARLDIFAAAMLGDLSVLQSILHLQPAALHARGPHTITLLAHAEAGGLEALPVVEFLKQCFTILP